MRKLGSLSPFATYVAGRPIRTTTPAKSNLLRGHDEGMASVLYRVKWAEEHVLYRVTCAEEYGEGRVLHVL